MKLNKSALLLLTVTSLFFSSTSFATCLQDKWGDYKCTKYQGGGIAKDKWGDIVCGAGECATDKWNDIVCSPFPGGSVMKDKWNDIVAGRGECIKDKWNDVVCAKSPGGSALLDKWGDAVCEGGCESGSSTTPASADQCTNLRPQIFLRAR